MGGPLEGGLMARVDKYRHIWINSIFVNPGGLMRVDKYVHIWISKYDANPQPAPAELISIGPHI
jgi:hypothetical protein